MQEAQEELEIQQPENAQEQLVQRFEGRVQAFAALARQQLEVYDREQRRQLVAHDEVRTTFLTLQQDTLAYIRNCKTQTQKIRRDAELFLDMIAYQPQDWTADTLEGLNAVLAQDQVRTRLFQDRESCGGRHPPDAILSTDCRSLTCLL